MAVEIGELVHATRLRAAPAAALISPSPYASFVPTGSGYSPPQTLRTEEIEGADPLSRPPSSVVSASSVAAAWIVPYVIPIGAGLLGVAIVWWIWKDGPK